MTVFYSLGKNRWINEFMKVPTLSWFLVGFVWTCCKLILFATMKLSKFRWLMIGLRWVVLKPSMLSLGSVFRWSVTSMFSLFGESLKFFKRTWFFFVSVLHMVKNNRIRRTRYKCNTYCQFLNKSLKLVFYLSFYFHSDQRSTLSFAVTLNNWSSSRFGKKSLESDYGWIMDWEWIGNCRGNL